MLNSRNASTAPCGWRIAWPNYRLADTIQFNKPTNHTLRHYSRSIGAAYIRHSDTYRGAGPRALEHDTALVWHLIDRLHPKDASIDSEYASIHLRLGDVIDQPVGIAPERRPLIEDLLCRQNEDRQVWGHYPNAYVHSLAVLRELARRLRQEYNVWSVHLFAGAFGVGYETQRNHAKLSWRFAKSCDYLRVVEAELAGWGISSVLHMGQRADEDIALMARSTLFVPSGGGLSALLALLVHAANHTVVYPQPQDFCHDRFVPHDLQTKDRLLYLQGCSSCHCNAPAMPKPPWQGFRCATIPLEKCHALGSEM
jgi:hypothetical protein